MKSFKQYLYEEETPKQDDGGERPPVSPQERHRRMSRGAALRSIISNRILRDGKKIFVALPPDIDPKAKEENR
jgi:hypothetical protein